MKQQDIDNITCFYKEAKNKNYAVGVLADMYLCSKRDIVELLQIKGLAIDPAVDSKYKPLKTRGYNPFSDEEKKLLYSCISKKMKLIQIYREFEKNGFNRSYDVLGRKRILILQKLKSLAVQR